MSGPLVDVLATSICTVVANEMHRRFTFRGASGGGSWTTGHGTGGAAAVLGPLLSSGALTLWQHVVPTAGHLSALIVVQALTAVVGSGDFLVLRGAASCAVGEHVQVRDGAGRCW